MCDHHEALQVDDACRCFSVSKGCKLVLTGVTIFFLTPGPTCYLRDSKDQHEGVAGLHVSNTHEATGETGARFGLPHISRT